MDAVLLASFALLHKGEKAADLGTGTGIIPVLMAARHPSAHFTGLEIQPDYVDMARRSVRFNHLENRIDIVEGDIKEAAALFGAASFQVVTSNPPYIPAGKGKKNSAGRVGIARHEILCTMEDVAGQASRILISAGRFYLVHRPFYLPRILEALKKEHLEPKRMRLVHPYADREPTLVLIESVKGARPELRIMPPLIIFEKDGVYTQEVERIYGGG